MGVTWHVTLPYLEAGIEKNSVSYIFTPRISCKRWLLYPKRISKQKAIYCCQEQWNLLTSAFLNDDVTQAAILGHFGKFWGFFNQKLLKMHRITLFSTFEAFWAIYYQFLMEKHSLHLWRHQFSSFSSKISV